MKIKLNDYSYRYDVYHMINIFYSGENLEFVENYPVDFEVNILKDKVICSNKIERCEFVHNDKYKFKDFLKKCLFKFLTKQTGKLMPWGILIGIRPSKIALEYLNEGKSEDEIIEIFKDKYCVREDKAKLCIEVGKRESSFINKDTNKISVYIDMPFCPTRCLYCSFSSNAVKGKKKLVRDYINSLIREMKYMSNFIKEKKLNIECVYFGGGTPTAINNEQFEEVMKNINECFIRNFNVEEFTVECGRPDSITVEKLNTMKKYNVNRISINPQTMNDKTLKLIGRNHTSKDVINKFNLARQMGFYNINMDIIVGLPGEKYSDIKNTCDIIRKLQPDNLTVHGLSIKRGSKLHENILNKQSYEIPSQEELNKMFDETFYLAKDLNMNPYYMYRQKNMVGNMENLGYANLNKECIYNMQMMEEKQTIIAVGADAVSKIVFLDENRLERFPNIKDATEYVKRLDEKIEDKVKLLETLY